MPFSHHEISAIPAWQARALDRSLSEARARSVERLSRFVAAARSLATESASAAFTVQQVVERSGQSLKSFYRLFDGKDDLLLALLEEDCAVGALFLAEMVEAHDDPVERVRAWVTGLFELMAAGDEGYVGVLVREYGRLSEERPDQMEQAVAPFLDLLVDLLERAQDSGAARAQDTRRDATLVFTLVLRCIHELALGRDPRPPSEVAEHVWSFCWHGMSEPDGTARRNRR
ncbi:TetR/AcrR family transcriptional regulator [Rhabdothermincola sp.]|uniref:TetR/AcrR family transcriptional regulator n=1 Tax=Rhabdothermincola sp. TaxID=2820405 RepID=UPI002FE1A985